jgi:hypothetical protein
MESGGQLIAGERIPAQDVMDSLEALEALEAREPRQAAEPMTATT